MKIEQVRKLANELNALFGTVNYAIGHDFIGVRAVIKNKTKIDICINGNDPVFVVDCTHIADRETLAEALGEISTEGFTKMRYNATSDALVCRPDLSDDTLGEYIMVAHLIQELLFAYSLKVEDQCSDICNRVFSEMTTKRALEMLDIEIDDELEMATLEHEFNGEITKEEKDLFEYLSGYQFDSAYEYALDCFQDKEQSVPTGFAIEIPDLDNFYDVNIYFYNDEHTDAEQDDVDLSPEIQMAILEDLGFRFQGNIDEEDNKPMYA